MQRHRSCGFLFAVALAASSSTAAAEKPKEPRPARVDEYGYTFTDESLLAGATGVLGMPVTIRIPPLRVTLIRPRTSFVVELLKSVENL